MIEYGLAENGNYKWKHLTDKEVQISLQNTFDEVNISDFSIQPLVSISLTSSNLSPSFLNVNGRPVQGKLKIDAHFRDKNVPKNFKKFEKDINHHIDTKNLKKIGMAIRENGKIVFEHEIAVKR